MKASSNSYAADRRDGVLHVSCHVVQAWLPCPSPSLRWWLCYLPRDRNDTDWHESVKITTICQWYAPETTNSKPDRDTGYHVQDYKDHLCALEVLLREDQLLYTFKDRTCIPKFVWRHICVSRSWPDDTCTPNRRRRGT